MNGLGGAPGIEDWHPPVITTSGSRDAASGNSGPLQTGPTGSYAFWLDALTDPTWAASVATMVTPPAVSAPAGSDHRYRYLGAKHRRTALPSGAITMGARVYVPQFGRFLQVDPVRGGADNAYDYAGQDRFNDVDLDGQLCLIKCIKRGIDVLTGFVVDHAAKVSTITGYAAAVSYGVCAFGGVGCVIGGAFTGISVGTEMINTANVCSKGVATKECAIAAATAAASASSMFLAGKLAGQPGFKQLPNHQDPMFAKGYFTRTGKVQVTVAAGTTGANATGNQPLQMR